MVEINLLPQQERRGSRPDAWRYATYAVLPLTAAVILIPELTLGSRLSSLRAERDQLNGEIAALTPTKQEYDRLQGEQRTLEQVTAVATQLRDSKTYWTNDVAAFSAQLPRGGGVAITSMNVKPLDPGALATMQQGGVYAGKNVVREIDLSGTASSQQSVVNFLNTFENSPNFAVNFRSLQQDGDTGRYTFAASVGVVSQAAIPAPGTPGVTGDGTPPSAPIAAAPAGGTDVR
ncbi:fimbrial assembly [Deinococcus aerius]|uniref:Fimbrial assembly n=1 Tax=Deinococcus aerius TaxID=200253 RepID=A0A2I9D4C0_9DEIO|nr:fimbrial assembly protein [Deinococcus aerius]GBF05130.1 fimbrial assembly [Deinococcus aerius]